MANLMNAIDRGEASYRNLWSVDYLIGKSSRKDMFFVPFSKLESYLLNNEEENLHVIAIKPNDKILARKMQKMIHPNFRFRWFDRNNFFLLASKKYSYFVNEFNNVLAEEEEWCGNVKPCSLQHPLLLPEMSFVSKGVDIWRQASHSGLERIIAAKRALFSFAKIHISKKRSGNGRVWLDAKDRHFDWSGPRHGKAPGLNGWKYSYPIEEGFHYDVTYTKGSFEINDYLNKSYLVPSSRHINICPHGHIRR